MNKLPEADRRVLAQSKSQILAQRIRDQQEAVAYYDKNWFPNLIGGIIGIGISLLFLLLFEEGTRFYGTTGGGFLFLNGLYFWYKRGREKKRLNKLLDIQRQRQAAQKR